MNKQCSECKNELECTLDESCWCMELPQVIIHTENTDCLCKVCLERLILG
jgi:hypothetical protein